MKIGNLWTKTTEDGKPYMSLAWDEVILEKYPILKTLSFHCWAIEEENRKSENSPHWIFSVSVKKEKQE